MMRAATSSLDAGFGGNQYCWYLESQIVFFGAIYAKLDGSFRAAVREVMRGLLDGAIDEKTAGKLLYGLQMERGNQ
ncbi:MAG: hypothetical protein ACRDRL_16830 [Sciscionella sp.]